jgi:multidrug resistance protein
MTGEDDTTRRCHHLLQKWLSRWPSRPGPKLDQSVYNHPYPGHGTATEPYVIDFLPDDPENGMSFSRGRKWTITMLQSLTTFAVTFASSAYASGIEGVAQHFHVSEEVATLGLSFFVLGFAVGPLVWAPLSEMYGRKSVFIVSYTGYVLFSIGAACAHNIASLLVLRFLASASGASSMANGGGVIADAFPKAERGLATGLFAMSPFLGPALGPIAGGFLAQYTDFRWILWLIAILGGAIWVPTIIATRESYAPFILRRRAAALHRSTGMAYISHFEASHPPRSLFERLPVAFTRPWALLFRDPVVFLSSLYIAIIYGTLYTFFSGFPILFLTTRGWSRGLAGLPFIGVAVGVLVATFLAGLDSRRYARYTTIAQKDGKQIQPEARLRLAMTGSVILPAGLFLFAWTTFSSVPSIFPVLGATAFSCGLVMVFISLIGYLVESCTFLPLVQERH